jgi:hypothetical protein
MAFFKMLKIAKQAFNLTKRQELTVFSTKNKEIEGLF